ncbi:Uncharacterised protein [Klebsiella pneumoniae subsp. ozaenae]|uniref:FHA domain-containing protein n=1 Tax=Klebsiella pneumoniae subsp. ozaenae TaxID=574 RepID=A0A377ZFP3_KLEPO|nr:Uncharacterised protein [Klebsiella pneumoniae subsp. ozaenae]
MPGEYHRRQNYRYLHEYALAWFSPMVKHLYPAAQQFVFSLIDRAIHICYTLRLQFGVFTTKHRKEVVNTINAILLLSNYLSTNGVFVNYGRLAHHRLLHLWLLGIALRGSSRRR